MPLPPKDPATRRRRNVTPTTRAVSTALPDTNRRPAPPPPAWLSRKLQPAYREVWRSSVAHLWPSSARELVARLVWQRDLVRRVGDDVKPAHLSALLQLERELLLAPKSARASGVTVRDESAPDPAELEAVDEAAGGRARARRSTVTADRRRRILRAVD